MNRITSIIPSLIIVVLVTGCAAVNNTSSADTAATDAVTQKAESLTDDRQPDYGYPLTKTLDKNVVDNVEVHTSITIPAESYSSYSCNLKAFDVMQLADTFWPGHNTEDLQVQSYDGGATSASYQGETIAVSSGMLRYLKDRHATDISDLIVYAQEKGLTTEKDLDFMTASDARVAAENLLKSISVGCDPDLTLIAASADDLQYFQETMRQDPEYSELYNAGVYTTYNFSDNDSLYYIDYSFQMGGIPVLGRKDPAIQMSGDGPLIAYSMQGHLMISQDGIMGCELIGVLDGTVVAQQPETIIQEDGIYDALAAKFGDVILADQYTVTNIQLEYFPLIKEDSFNAVELIPTWCCEFAIDGMEDSGYALRFNAITGEEIS